MQSKWIHIENPETSEENIINLAEITNAVKKEDGTLLILMTSGNSITLSGAGGWVEEVWTILKKMAMAERMESLR